jgi:hypothetical protein
MDNNIDNVIMDIEKTTDLLNKINLIKKVNNMIEEEKNKINNILENDFNLEILHDNYKDFDIDEIIKMIDDTSDIYKQIKLYQTLTYKINIISIKLFL